MREQTVVLICGRIDLETVELMSRYIFLVISDGINCDGQSEVSKLEMEATDWLSILNQPEASKFEMEAPDWLSILNQPEASKFEMEAPDWLIKKIANLLVLWLQEWHRNEQLWYVFVYQMYPIKTKWQF